MSTLYQVGKAPLIFFCSSLGDAELAKDTMRRLSETSARACSIIALSSVVEQSLSSFAAEFPNVTMVTKVNDKLIKACGNQELADFVKNFEFSHAFIGMPSDDEETRAMETALLLDIPVIFASEFLFVPPSTHAIWNYQARLGQKENIQVTVPLSNTSLFAEHPRRHIVGHRALSKMLSNPRPPMSVASISLMRSQLNVTESAHLVVISGTTRAPGIDTEFLSELLAALPNHPTVQLRFSIHPGVKQNMAEYIRSLLVVARIDKLNQFKIILNDKIKVELKLKLTEAEFDEFLINPCVIDIDISGPDASSVADAIAQAVPGELVNMAAFQAKIPTFTKGSLLPISWFAHTPDALMHPTQAAEPHTLSELNLSEETTDADAIMRLML